VQPSLRWHTSVRCDVGRWQWVAVAWFATLLLTIGVGFYYIAGGEQPPSDLVVASILLTVSGSWIMIKASIAEGGER
jgi:hypothetical protein